MKLIHDGLSIEGEEREGSITFEFEGYVYQIGDIDCSPGWFSRQTVDDYYNDRDNHQTPTGWADENRKPDFKFLNKEY
jgi:hypothetical protein